MSRNTLVRAAGARARSMMTRRIWRLAFAIFTAMSGVASLAYGQATYQVVAAFDPPFPGGAYPYAGLMQASDGSFYGTTS